MAMRKHYERVAQAPLQDWRGFFASLLDNPYVAAIICAAAVLWMISTLVDVNQRFDEFGFNSAESDFAAYYTWGQAMRDGVNPYTSDLRDTALKLGLATDRYARANYPPTFILVLEPFTLLSFKTAFWVWTGLNLAAFLLALFLLLGKDSGLTATAGLALGSLLLFWRPIEGDLLMGQPHMMLLAMMVAASLCFSRRKDLAGGLILAIAGLLKVYPLFLVGYLVVKRRWRAVYFTALGLLIGAAATAAVTGFAYSIAFVGQLIHLFTDFLAIRHLSGDARLINIDAFVSRLFWQITGTGPGAAMDWVRHLLVLFAQINVLVLSAYATAVSRVGRGYDQAAFALWVVTAALLAPTAWVHYTILLLFVFAVLGAAAFRGQASSLAIWLGSVSFLLDSFLYPLIDRSGAALPPAAADWLQTNFLAVLTILAYASAWQLTRDLSRFAAVREAPQASTC